MNVFSDVTEGRFGEVVICMRCYEKSMDLHKPNPSKLVKSSSRDSLQCIIRVLLQIDSFKNPQYYIRMDGYRSLGAKSQSGDIVNSVS